MELAGAGLVVEGDGGVASRHEIADARFPIRSEDLGPYETPNVSLRLELMDAVPAGVYRIEIIETETLTKRHPGSSIKAPHRNGALEERRCFAALFGRANCRV